MKITGSQIAALDQLRCVRISSDTSHLYLVDTFANSKNQNLVQYLQNEANGLDEERKTICYLVKDENDNIIAYFSLRCGLLFDREGDIEKIEAKKKLSNLLLRQRILANNKDLADSISSELKKSIDSLREELARHYQMDDNDVIHKRVAHTYSGIEIAHFCVNDNIRDYWSQIGMPDSSRPGATVFWYHIVPLILRANEFIGAEYVYLFAADSSHDGLLINYYKDKMRFAIPSGIYSILPIYDFGCQLLYQPIGELSVNRDSFLNSFNPDSDAI